MSIFNLQALEEKVKAKKIELENKKKEQPKVTTNIDMPTSENVFVITMREINDVANNINVNIAYKESIQKEISEDPSLFKDVMTDFMNIFTNINENLKEKCLAIKTSIDILKSRIDPIEDGEEKVLKLKIDCDYTNLGYLKDSIIPKELISSELSMDTAEIEHIDDIRTFRNTIRRMIFNETQEDLVMSKSEYIIGLYNLFRHSYTETDEEKYIEVDKNSILELITEAYQLPLLFDHDCITIYNYLDQLYKNENLQLNDTITKRVEVILEEFAMVYSARADAIVEYMDKIREYASKYVETYGGGDDE